MGIKVKDAQSAVEKADAIANLIEQMHMAHRLKDEETFKKAHKRASDYAFQLVRFLEEN